MDQIIAFVSYLVDLFLNLDVHLNELVVTFGVWVYLILFLIIFCETGLVVTPFLPGDSLLFATGALAAIDGSPLDVRIMAFVLFCAAVAGDATNYLIGRKIGPKIFAAESSWLLNKKHLHTAQAFYERHGGKTVIIARFAPIVRTFAPFVAGIGRMDYKKFQAFNVVGSLLWVPPFLFGGYFLGNLPAVKRNFHVIIVAIVVISVAPAFFQFLKERQRSRAARTA